MSNTESAELVFVLAMMLLLLAISFIGVYFFVRQFRREKKDSEMQKLRDIEARKKQADRKAAAEK